MQVYVVVDVVTRVVRRITVVVYWAVHETQVRVQLEQRVRALLRLAVPSFKLLQRPVEPWQPMGPTQHRALRPLLCISMQPQP